MDVIVMTGGGTGGHVIPMLSIADALKGRPLLYIGSRHGFERDLAKARGIPYQSIMTRGLMGRGILGKVKTLFLIGLGFFQSIKILAVKKPRLVIGTGGYVSSPVFLAASALGIPTLLLEQNLLPGRTVRFLAKKVTKVLVSFEESKSYLPGASTVVTGNPVSCSIGKIGKEEACRRLGLAADKPVVLAMGASQGAKAINEALIKALPGLKKKPWQILHLTGEKHFGEVSEKSRKILEGGGLIYKAFPFADQMQNFYGAADLIVSRAGATTLAEVTLAGKPSIMVPYPYAADNHQELNARWLEKNGGCKVILEKDFSAERFLSELETLMSDPKSLKSMGENAARVSRPDALQNVLRIVEQTAG